MTLTETKLFLKDLHRLLKNSGVVLRIEGSRTVVVDPGDLPMIVVERAVALLDTLKAQIQKLRP